MAMPRKCFIIVGLLILLACPVSVFSQEPDHPRYVPGEVLVKFRSGISQKVARSSHRSLGSRTIKRFKRVDVDHVKIPEGWSVEETIEMYTLDPDVEYVEPNYYRYAMVTPDDTHFDLQWALHNTGQTGGTDDADIDAPEAWEVQTGSSNVVIAVIDTGADLDHEDLTDNIWTNTGEDWVDGSPGNNGSDDDGNGKIDDYYGWDFANDDNDPDDDYTGVYHGTHVTGIIAAKGDNTTGVTGVCWSASVMLLKILNNKGSGSISDEINAINYAISKGAKIINVSFGGSGYSQFEYESIQTARDAGVLFVAAAGNTGADNDSAPVYPASYDLDNIISVAATDHDDNLANFSNYGKDSVDVAAPGVQIRSTSADDNYQNLSGTSMATPHVSGLAGLILAEDSSLTYSQVKDRIVNGVDTKASLNEKVLTGGRINASNSLALPRCPSDLAATAPSSTQVTLTWTDNSSTETGFGVERKTGSGGSYSEITTAAANETSYGDTEVNEAGTYYYRVRAYNSTGPSSYSSEVCVNCATVSTSSSGSSGGSSGGGCFIGTATSW